MDALPGSRRFAFSRGTVACAAIPLRRCRRPSWNRSYVVSLTSKPPEIRKVLLHQVKRIGQVPGSPRLDRRDRRAAVDRTLKRVGDLVGSLKGRTAHSGE